MYICVNQLYTLEQKRQIILSILKKILGSPKRELDISEFEFNCKTRTCINDHDKFNLAYNANENLFHCWKCKYSGTVHKIAEDYGSKEDVNRLYSLVPKKKFTGGSKKKTVYNEMLTCSLPEDYKPLWKKSNSKYYKSAVFYATGNRKGQRGLSWETIKKYQIGYTENAGNRKYRLIIPSFNAFGQINYYVARAYYDFIKPSYLGPPKEEVAASEIIFNIKNINFDIPIFLVEGVFDMFHLYNSIPLLGKEINPILLKKLIKHKSRVVLCLDEDALSDSIKIYNELSSYGLDVYFVEIQGDIDEFAKANGKNATVELLKTCRKIDFQYLFQKLALKEKSKKRDFVDENSLRKEWEEMKKDILKDQDE